jgi:hypothetical protein
MSDNVRGDQILDLIRERHPGYHPLLSLADIAHEEEASLKLRADCHTTIAKYCEQQLKSVEVKAKVDADFGTLNVRLMADDKDKD